MICFTVSMQQEQVQSAHAKFHAIEGDHMTLLNVFEKFKLARLNTNDGSGNDAEAKVIHSRVCVSQSSVYTEMVHGELFESSQSGASVTCARTNTRYCTGCRSNIEILD